MMIKFSRTRPALLLASTMLACFSSSSPVFADGFAPYRIHMDRENPAKAIRKSAIMTEVRNTYPGDILYIGKDQSGGDDCHVVKSMGKDGEFRIIRVACSN